jgi:hypothetical protein
MVLSKWKINTCLTAAIVLAGLGMGAIKAMAAERNTGVMDACRVEVNQRFGQEMDIRVINKRRIPAGIELKLAARLDRDNVEFLNCWVPNDETAGGDLDQRSNALAVTVRPVPVIQ